MAGWFLFPIVGIFLWSDHLFHKGFLVNHQYYTPTNPTNQPTNRPTDPTNQPTNQPTVTAFNIPWLFSIFTITFSRFLVKWSKSSLLRCDWGETATSFPDGSPMTVPWKHSFGIIYHPKINMSPKKGPFQKETSLPTIIFEGLC